MSDSLQPHESQHARPPCPSPTLGVYPNPCPSSRWCHPAISSSVIPFSSCPQSFPALWSFPMTLTHGPNILGSYANCFLQHWTLLLSPVTSITGYCFCFCSIPSFFLELFLHWSPVAYWAPTDLGSSSFSVLSFCLFILFMGFSRQEYWRGLPVPSPVNHILSDLSTMTRPSWVTPHSMA